MNTLNPKNSKLAEETFLSRSDLARRWGLSTMTIRRREKSGTIRFLKLGRGIRIRLSEIERIEAEAEIRL